MKIIGSPIVPWKVTGKTKQNVTCPTCGHVQPSLVDYEKSVTKDRHTFNCGMFGYSMTNEILGLEWDESLKKHVPSGEAVEEMRALRKKYLKKKEDQS